MSKLSMSEIVASYNALAAQQGKPEVSSFKNLAAARAALAELEAGDTAAPDTAAPDEELDPNREVIPETNNSGPKYNTAGKRGPTQGVGAFCKELIAEGKTNDEVLAAVAEKFPDAKTTRNCVAYYRTKMKAAAKATEEAAPAEATEEAEAA